MNTQAPDQIVKFRCNRAVVWACAIAAVLLLFTTDVRAQNKGENSAAPPTAQTHPTQPMLWDVETMMEQAVQQISKRYSLNAQQESYTRLLLKNRVQAFLDEHEAEVRELLQESIDMRMDPSKADPTSLKMWAERAMPLYQKASQAILEGNEEWGDILNDDQKQIHDGDMRLMRSSFEGVTRTMQQWKEGHGKLSGGTKPVTTKQPTSNSDAASDKTDGAVSNPQKPVEAHNIEDNWLSYVNMFVSAYNLEEAAKVSAKEKIYKEQFNKAARYRQRRAMQFDRIAKQLKQLPPTEATKRQAVQERLRKLERPIYDYFVEMDERLKTLPTASQAAEVDTTRKSQLEQLYVALSGKNNRKSVPGRSDKTDTPKETPKPKQAETTAPKATSSKPSDDVEKPTTTDSVKPAKKDDAESADADEKSEKPDSEKKPSDDSGVAA